MEQARLNFALMFHTTSERTPCFPKRVRNDVSNCVVNRADAGKARETGDSSHGKTI